MAYQVGITITSRQKEYIRAHNISPSAEFQKMLNVMMIRDSLEYEDEVSQLKKEVLKWKNIKDELQAELLKEGE